MFTASFEHPFAHFALGLYRHPEVAQCCITWQDSLGLDVNLLLWATWLDSQSLVFEESFWAGGSEQVRGLRECLIKPLRGIRRAVKPVPVLYRRMKGIELWAESIAMRRLYQYSQANSLGVCQRDSLGQGIDNSYCQYYLTQLRAGQRVQEWLNVIRLVQEKM